MRWEGGLGGAKWESSWEWGFVVGECVMEEGGVAVVEGAMAPGQKRHVLCGISAGAVWSSGVLVPSSTPAVAAWDGTETWGDPSGGGRGVGIVTGVESGIVVPQCQPYPSTVTA